MEEVAPGIFIESGYPPYNLGLIDLDDGALVVDIPPRSSHAQAWLEQVQAAVGTVRYVVLTDAQIERLVAAALWNIPVIASEAALRTVAKFEERDWRDLLQATEERYPEDADLLDDVKPNPPKFAFSRRFKFHRTTPPFVFEGVAGAAPGSITLFVPEHKLLFAGDTVSISEPPPMHLAPDFDAWLASLEALAERTDVRHIVPGRGDAPVLRGELATQLEFMRVVQETAQALAEGSGSEGVSKAARELGQAFFNQMGKQAVKRLQSGLEYLIQDLRGDLMPPADKEEEEA
jgi:glyoxylase-like metal-dependent hydrolase (beta-lactamase superfamily II)